MPARSETTRRIEALVRPIVRQQAAYHVPPPADLIKLDAMENPYDWPGGLLDEWLEVLKGLALNRYPDAGASALSAALRQAMDIPDGAGIVLGNGSDEIIQFILLAVAEPDRVVLSPEPGFVMYRILAQAVGMQYQGIGLNATDFALDLDAMLAAIRQAQPAVVFLAYPNNPTGNLYPVEQVEAIIEAAPGLVVVDEAYEPFAQATFMHRVLDYPNLLVMRTVSKMGLAGLRLGYLVGAPDWIEQINKLRLPYNINTLTQVSACFALEHREIMDRQTASIREDRAGLFRDLNALPGVHAWPSATNFILLRTPPGRARPLFECLRERGVLIKCMDGSSPLLADCLRVTVGTPAENEALLRELDACLRASAEPGTGR